MKRYVSFFVYLALVLASASAKTGSINIPKPAFLGAVNSQASKMQIYLDTMGPFKNAGSDSATWYYDGSFVQLPTGHRLSFPIPRIMATGAFRRYEFFVNNFATDTIHFSRQGSQWKLRITAKDNNQALMVGCINRRKDKPCKVHALNHKAAIKNFYIDLFFTLKFDGPRVTLMPNDVHMDFDYKIHSLVLNTAAKIINYFKNIKDAARNALKTKLMDELKKDEIKKYLSVDLDDLIFDKLVDFLPSSLAGKAEFVDRYVDLKSIACVGNNFRLVFSYPDIVTQLTVSSVQLRPIIRDLKRTCPFVYGFKATIRTTGKVSGTAYLQFSNGDRGRTVPWAMNGAGETESTIGLPVDGSEGAVAKSGYVRLVIRYTGFPPVQYTKYSPYTLMTARCSSGGGSSVGNITT